MLSIIPAVLCVGGAGLLIAVFLSFFGNHFRVEVDEREEKILEALPGNNCGGCGYPGCSGLAAAIVKGEAPVNGCPVGGGRVAKEVGLIMGIDAGKELHMVAHVKCRGTCDKSGTDYEYYGVKDCRMLAFTPGGGPKSCDYGCMGYGSCKDICPFDAISILDGVAVIDPDKCKACSKCLEVCPKGIIEMIPYAAGYMVDCSSKDKGSDVMKVCRMGCIGCGICQKTCPVGAALVSDFLAHIDQEKCVGCGACAEKCPKKIITKIRA